MDYLKSKIIRDVKIVLDENEDTFLTLDVEGKIADPDQLQTDTIIESLIPSAVDKVHRMATLDYLADIADGTAYGATWVDYDNHCSRLANIPKDFVRLIYVRLDGWRRGVTSFLGEDDALYATYFSKYSGVRPTSVTPSAAIVNAASGLGIDIIACPRSNGGTSQFRYIHSAVESDDTGFTIAEKCYRAVVYMIANLYYVTIGEKQRADMMAAECVEQLGLQANADASV